jgi:hypothetical protein
VKALNRWNSLSVCAYPSRNERSNHHSLSARFLALRSACHSVFTGRLSVLDSPTDTRWVVRWRAPRELWAAHVPWPQTMASEQLEPYVEMLESGVDPDTQTMLIGEIANFLLMNEGASLHSRLVRRMQRIAELAARDSSGVAETWRSGVTLAQALARQGESSGSHAALVPHAGLIAILADRIESALELGDKPLADGILEFLRSATRHSGHHDLLRRRHGDGEEEGDDGEDHLHEALASAARRMLQSMSRLTLDQVHVQKILSLAIESANSAQGDPAPLLELAQGFASQARRLLFEEPAAVGEKASSLLAAFATNSVSELESLLEMRKPEAPPPTPPEGDAPFLRATARPKRRLSPEELTPRLTQCFELILRVSAIAAPCLSHALQSADSGSQTVSEELLATALQLLRLPESARVFQGLAVVSGLERAVCAGIRSVGTDLASDPEGKLRWLSLRPVARDVCRVLAYEDDSEFPASELRSMALLEPDTSPAAAHGSAESVLVKKLLDVGTKLALASSAAPPPTAEDVVSEFVSLELMASLTDSSVIFPRDDEVGHTLLTAASAVTAEAVTTSAASEVVAEVTSSSSAFLQEFVESLIVALSGTPHISLATDPLITGLADIVDPPDSSCHALPKPDETCLASPPWVAEADPKGAAIARALTAQRAKLVAILHDAIVYPAFEDTVALAGLRIAYAFVKVVSPAVIRCMVRTGAEFALRSSSNGHPVVAPDGTFSELPHSLASLLQWRVLVAIENVFVSANPAIGTAVDRLTSEFAAPPKSHRDAPATHPMQHSSRSVVGFAARSGLSRLSPVRGVSRGSSEGHVTPARDPRLGSVVSGSATRPPAFFSSEVTARAPSERASALMSASRAKLADLSCTLPWDASKGLDADLSSDPAGFVVVPTCLAQRALSPFCSSAMVALASCVQQLAELVPQHGPEHMRAILSSLARLREIVAHPCAITGFEGMVVGLPSAIAGFLAVRPTDGLALALRTKSDLQDSRATLWRESKASSDSEASAEAIEAVASPAEDVRRGAERLAMLAAVFSGSGPHNPPETALFRIASSCASLDLTTSALPELCHLLQYSGGRRKRGCWSTIGHRALFEQPTQISRFFRSVDVFELRPSNRSIRLVADRVRMQGGDEHAVRQAMASADSLLRTFRIAVPVFATAADVKRLLEQRLIRWSLGLGSDAYGRLRGFHCVPSAAWDGRARPHRRIPIAWMNREHAALDQPSSEPDSRDTIVPGALLGPRDRLIHTAGDGAVALYVVARDAAEDVVDAAPQRYVSIIVRSLSECTMRVWITVGRAQDSWDAKSSPVFEDDSVLIPSVASDSAPILRPPDPCVGLTEESSASTGFRIVLPPGAVVADAIALTPSSHANLGLSLSWSYQAATNRTEDLMSWPSVLPVAKSKASLRIPPRALGSALEAIFPAQGGLHEFIQAPGLGPNAFDALIRSQSASSVFGELDPQTQAPSLSGFMPSAFGMAFAVRLDGSRVAQMSAEGRGPRQVSLDALVNAAAIGGSPFGQKTLVSRPPEGEPINPVCPWPHFLSRGVSGGSFKQVRGFFQRPAGGPRSAYSSESEAYLMTIVVADVTKHVPDRPGIPVDRIPLGMQTAMTPAQAFEFATAASKSGSIARAFSLLGPRGFVTRRREDDSSRATKLLELVRERFPGRGEDLLGPSVDEVLSRLGEPSVSKPSATSTGPVVAVTGTDLSPCGSGGSSMQVPGELEGIPSLDEEDALALLLGFKLPAERLARMEASRKELERLLRSSDATARATTGGGPQAMAFRLVVQSGDSHSDLLCVDDRDGTFGSPGTVFFHVRPLSNYMKAQVESIGRAPRESGSPITRSSSAELLRSSPSPTFDEDATASPGMLPEYHERLEGTAGRSKLRYAVLQGVRFMFRSFASCPVLPADCEEIIRCCSNAPPAGMPEGALSAAASPSRWWGPLEGRIEGVTRGGNLNVDDSSRRGAVPLALRVRWSDLFPASQQPVVLTASDFARFVVALSGPTNSHSTIQEHAGASRTYGVLSKFGRSYLRATMELCAEHKSPLPTWVDQFAEAVFLFVADKEDADSSRTAASLLLSVCRASEPVWTPEQLDVIVTELTRSSLVSAVRDAHPELLAFTSLPSATGGSAIASPVDAVMTERDFVGFFLEAAVSRPHALARDLGHIGLTSEGNFVNPPSFFGSWATSWACSQFPAWWGLGRFDESTTLRTGGSEAPRPSEAWASSEGARVSLGFAVAGMEAAPPPVPPGTHETPPAARHTGWTESQGYGDRAPADEDEGMGVFAPDGMSEEEMLAMAMAASMQESSPPSASVGFDLALGEESPIVEPVVGEEEPVQDSSVVPTPPASSSTTHEEASTVLPMEEPLEPEEEDLPGVRPKHLPMPVAQALELEAILDGASGVSSQAPLQGLVGAEDSDPALFTAGRVTNLFDRAKDGGARDASKTRSPLEGVEFLHVRSEAIQQGEVTLTAAGGQPPVPSADTAAPSTRLVSLTPPRRSEMPLPLHAAKVLQSIADVQEAPPGGVWDSSPFSFAEKDETPKEAAALPTEAASATAAAVAAVAASATKVGTASYESEHEGSDGEEERSPARALSRSLGQSTRHARNIEASKRQIATRVMPPEETAAEMDWYAVRQVLARCALEDHPCAFLRARDLAAIAAGAHSEAAKTLWNSLVRLDEDAIAYWSPEAASNLCPRAALVGVRWDRSGAPAQSSESQELADTVRLGVATTAVESLFRASRRDTDDGSVSPMDARIVRALVSKAIENPSAVVDSVSSAAASAAVEASRSLPSDRVALGIAQTTRLLLHGREVDDDATVYAMDTVASNIGTIASEPTSSILSGPWDQPEESPKEERDETPAPSEAAPLVGAQPSNVVTLAGIPVGLVNGTSLKPGGVPPPDSPPGEGYVGCYVALPWCGGSTWYGGTVRCTVPSHGGGPQLHVVDYDDGDSYVYDLSTMPHVVVALPGSFGHRDEEDAAAHSSVPVPGEGFPAASQIRLGRRTNSDIGAREVRRKLSSALSEVSGGSRSYGYGQRAPSQPVDAKPKRILHYEIDAPRLADSDVPWLGAQPNGEAMLRDAELLRGAFARGPLIQMSTPAVPPPRFEPTIGSIDSHELKHGRAVVVDVRHLISADAMNAAVRAALSLAPTAPLPAWRGRLVADLLVEDENYAASGTKELATAASAGDVDNPRSLVSLSGAGAFSQAFARIAPLARAARSIPRSSPALLAEPPSVEGLEEAVLAVGSYSGSWFVSQSALESAVLDASTLAATDPSLAELIVAHSPWLSTSAGSTEETLAGDSVASLMTAGALAEELSALSLPTYSEGRAMVGSMAHRILPPRSLRMDSVVLSLEQQLADNVAVALGCIPAWVTAVTLAIPQAVPFRLRRRWFFYSAFGPSRRLLSVQQELGEPRQGEPMDRALSRAKARDNDPERLISLEVKAVASRSELLRSARAIFRWWCAPGQAFQRCKALTRRARILAQAEAGATRPWGGYNPDERVGLQAQVREIHEAAQGELDCGPVLSEDEEGGTHVQQNSRLDMLFASPPKSLREPLPSPGCDSLGRRRGELSVTFAGEDAHGAGVTREFYTLVFRELRRTALGLWQDTPMESTTTSSIHSSNSGLEASLTGSHSSHAVRKPRFVFAPHGLFPSPLPEDAEDAARVLDLFVLAGRAVAKALEDGHRDLDLPLSVPFAKLILGSPVSLRDIATVEPGMEATVRLIERLVCQLEHADVAHDDALRSKVAAECDALCLTWIVGDTPLCPGGDDVPLTVGNLRGFARALVHTLLVRPALAQAKAFRYGFANIASVSRLRMFTAEEFVGVISDIRGEGGRAWMDHLWEADAILSNLVFHDSAQFRYERTDKQIQWFIAALSALTPEGRRLFLEFATASPRLPDEGFAALRPRRLQVNRKQPRDGLSPDEEAITCRVCSTELSLPAYSSEQVLRARLHEAISSIADGSGGFRMHA